MLLNPKNKAAADRKFQRYLDTEEIRLFRRLAPVVQATVNIQLNRGSQYAAAYMVERTRKTLLSEYRRIFTDQYKAIDAATQTSKADDGLTLTKFILMQLAWMRTRATNIAEKVAETLTQEILNKISIGIREGKSNDDIARNIRREAPSISRARAQTIARTETHTAALQAIKQSVQYKRITIREKEWWSAGDSRVRPTHAAVHGTRIAFDAQFTVGDWQMDGPGDPSAGAEEVINCRCSLLMYTRSERIAVEDSSELGEDNLADAD